MEIQEKRKIRKLWQTTRDPNVKTLLNRASKDLKSMLLQIENDEMASYLQNLSATKATAYSPWKATKTICKQTPHSSAIKNDNGNWTKSDAEKKKIANHLSDVFKPFPRNMTQEEERILLENQASQYLHMLE